MLSGTEFETFSRDRELEKRKAYITERPQTDRFGTEDECA